MPNYSLSEKSIVTLQGVHPRLVTCVQQAIKLSSMDFTVFEGIRTKERQQKLFNEGKSQTLNSKHLTGHAVDLVALPNNKMSWELEHYFEIAEAMKKAALWTAVSIRWGAAWNVGDIRFWNRSMKALVDHYKASKKNPFIDPPHFEIFE